MLPRNGFWDYSRALDELEGMDPLEICDQLHCRGPVDEERMGFVPRLKIMMEETLETHGLCLDCLKRPKPEQMGDPERTCRVQECIHFTK